MSNLIIGLTGGIGSGKTTVANLFKQYDIDIIDADIVARQVVAKGAPALQQIQLHFGEDYLLPNGELNRTKLRHKVFQEPEAKQWLNTLLHPLIREEMITQCQQAKSPYCLLVAPLLIENSLFQTVDKVLVVDIPEQEQIKRTMTRDENTQAQVEAIMASQVSRQERLKHADFVIENTTGEQEQLPLKVEQLHRHFLKLIAK
ncbi:dephospho-CoA kinase [Thalassotalea mangrovi]|uniref:Dephospho-CoA kinase n=1 Tax=Thalassotalea mangrovi TaxID=2572245 RepID=A0A4U1B9K3_9GAMM|nr:dephospho-CoA kinase [Thalassotalea mangrovi]TKB47064.1 dephospho-CoA kinase [Thalassotalea mangrovi]